MLAAMSGNDFDFGPSPGKSGLMSGRIAEASAVVSPDCCAIWAMPDQRPIEPASARQSCTASFAEEMAVVAMDAGPWTAADQIVPVASMATQIIPIMPFPPYAGLADRDSRRRSIVFMASGQVCAGPCDADEGNRRLGGE